METEPTPDQLRDRLLPLAEKLAESSRSAGEKIDSEDARKLQEAAAKLREGLVDKEAIPSDLRKARHDWKNQLNHIVGPVQFIEMDTPEEERPSEVAGIIDLCNQCLAILDGSGPAPGQPLDPSPKAPATGRILVADDEPENRDILERLLTDQGHEVDFAENGREALEKIRETDPDAVLLDINMPELDGFGVLEALRESGELRHTPVIVVTGLQEERDAIRCIEIGAEDFLSRPIRPAFLTARLNASLEKKRLREQMFAQYFTPELAREFARNPDPTKMKGRSAEVTVLFCDIRRFSAIAERLGPESTVDWLSGVMGEFSGSVLEHGGVLVDYTGDELLAMWGAPSDQPDHAEQACRAAMEMVRRLPELNAEWNPRIGADTDIGIGISSGTALVGNVGTNWKFKYGPLGTTVNLGSRVQGATKFLGTSVLATGETIAQLPADALLFRRLCRVRVQNITEPVELFEIATPGREGWEDLREQYELALSEFEGGEFQRASALLGDLLVRFPGDGPSLQLMSRVVSAMQTGDAGFDSIWELPGK